MNINTIYGYDLDQADIDGNQLTYSILDTTGLDGEMFRLRPVII